MLEHTERFDCFGGRCAVAVEGPGLRGDPDEAARWARRHLLAWHQQFSRFIAESELSQINADARVTVRASPLMIELAAAIQLAGQSTGGVVDGTLVAALEAAGYGETLGAPGTPRTRPSPERAGGRPPGGTRPATGGVGDWSRISVDRTAGTISRPAGVQLDSGGLVKGLLADVLVGWLGSHEDVLVDCCGDLAIGGTDPASREVEIAHPLHRGTAHTLEILGGGVATSGTTHRRWQTADGLAAHHLLDPSTGEPAQSGLIQVTAVAPTALEAEVLAKWALLGGRETAAARLPHGGVVIDDAGELAVYARRRTADGVPSTP